MHLPTHPAPAGPLDFDFFLEAARPKLSSMLAACKVPPEDAEDLVHDALVTLLQQGLGGIANPEAWLLGILRIKILQYWRRQTRQGRILLLLASAIVTSVPAPQGRQDAMRDVLALTAHLPPRALMVLWLRFGLGYKPREIAARLHCRPDSVRQLTRRALALARRDLTPGSHPHAPWREAPAAASLRRSAAASRHAAARGSTGPPAMTPTARQPNARRLREARGRSHRRRAARRTADRVTPTT